jgi:molybdenum cofactor cytidylyltransferase/nicotine blue oxidoreductase
MGTPKSLVRDADGTSWLQRSVAAMQEGGCDAVTVVLGAAAAEAAALVPRGVAVVVAEDWSTGMGASLRAGLAALTRGGESAVLVSLVDLTDVGSDVVARVLADPTTGATLRRATYDGRPGHPVVIGREHWQGVLASATGDRGARSYLRTHDVELVECGDLASGADVDARAVDGARPTSGQPAAE